MQLTFNTFALHELGEFTIVQSRAYDGGDAPQRVKATVAVTLHLFAGFTDSAAVLLPLREALKTPQGRLLWRDEAANVTLLDQPVVIEADDMPEDPNAWGAHHQQINLRFFYYEQDLATGNIPITFKAGGSTVTMTMGTVSVWDESLSIERFDPLHSERERATGKISASGLLLADALDDLEARRSALLTLKTNWLKQVNAKEGVLTFGEFSETIKLEEFTANVDEGGWAIRWTMTASYVRFPVGAYRTCRYTADQHDDLSGPQTLSLQGSIQAVNEAQARAKLADVKTAVLAAYGYGSGASELLRDDAAARFISANTDGDACVELTFNVEYRRMRPGALSATFESTDLGGVTMFEEGYQARRYSEYHPQRQQAAGRGNMTGFLKGNNTSLLAQKNALLAAVNGKDGVLTFGTTFSQRVKVESFIPKVNHAVSGGGIDWSLSFVYTRFPDEGNFSLTEFRADIRDDSETGDTFLIFSGRITASDAAVAAAKLASLRATVLASNGYVSSMQIRQENSANSVDADTDGVAFIELSFNEEYRKRKADILSWTMKVSDRQDVRSGLDLITYAGSVTSSGSDAAAAYAASLTKAQSLGDNKGTFKVSSSITYDQRQVHSDGRIETVRLDFSYEYQGKLATGQAYLEINQEIFQNTFDANTESVSGFVTAASFSEAQAIYASRVRGIFASARLILSERTGQQQQQKQSGSGYVAQEIRFDFSLTLHKVKPTGSYAIKYDQQSDRNFLTCELRTVINGTIFADNETNAKSQLDTFINAIADIGKRTQSTRTTDFDHVVGQSGSPFFIALKFSETFSKNLTGVTTIVESELNQELKYSSTRWVVQPLPTEVSIVQNAGVEHGERTISGYVTSPVLEVCLVWAKKQRALLTGDLNGNSYEQPQRIKVSYTFAPLVEGDSNANVRIHRADFTFAELLPNYPMPAVGLDA